MRITFPLPAIALTFALAACSSVVPAPTPTPAPTPAPAPAPAPAPISDDWTDWPLAQGDWVYRADSRGSLALFGAPNAEADFIIRCDRNEKRIYISRAGNISSGQMTLRATSGLQTYTARNTGGALAYAAISLAPDDYMLDRIVFSRGRFAVETTGLAPLAIPTWTEFNRVVEDCR